MTIQTWKPTSPVIGAQPIDVTSTTQQHPLGTIMRAKSDTYGEGEFIYQKGVASTAIGDLCIFDEKAATSTRAVAGSRGACGVAMSANVALGYGWYQVGGSAVVKAGTVAAGGAVFATATPGTVDDAVVATDKVEGARFKTADGTPAAGFAVVELSRPALNGNG
jgi:hypothetical protein